MKLRFLLLFAISVGILLNCGCDSGNSSRAKPTKLVVWGVSLGPNDKGQSDVFREFERLHPGVEVETLMMGSGGMNPQKLMTSIVGKTPPDVVYQDRFTLADWASRGAFRPLDDFVANDPRFKLSEYYPATVEEATYKGKLYGIPWMADTRILTWNRSVFKEKSVELRRAGLDPDRAPRTWSELLAYSKVLTEKNPDGTLKRAGFIPNFGNAWFTMYAVLNRAKLLSDDGTRCTLDSAEAVESLEFMRQCYQILGGMENSDRFATTFRGEAQDAFFTGQIAMKIDGDWALAGIARFAPDLDFGSAAPPVPDDRFYKRGRFKNEPNVASTWAGGYAWCIPKGAKNEQLAWEFIAFVNSFEGRMMEVRRQDDLNRSRGQMTFPRITAHRPTNEQCLKEFMPSNRNLAAAVVLHSQLLDVAEVRPVSFAGKVIWDESNRATEYALRGGLSSSGSLTAGRVRIQRVLDEELQSQKYQLADLRVPFAVGILGLVIVFALLIARARATTRQPLKRQSARWGLLFVSPWLLGFFVLTLGPLVSSLVLSFTQYNALQNARWVGWKNYSDLLDQDREMLLKAFSNVFYLAGIGVPLGIVTGLSIALLLNAPIRGIGLFRSLFYLPSILPGIATVILWMWLLHPDPAIGLVNFVWSQTISVWFQIPTPTWILSEEWAKPALIFMGLSGAGGGIFIWLAGLKGISRQLYEAAEIDGASAKAQFWSITLPQMSPLIFFNCITGVIGALQIFDPIYVSNGGNGAGPNDSLLVPVFYLFNNAFSYFRIGYASALAWLVFGVILALTGLQFIIAKRFVHYEVDS